jgi:hypothetical protein
MSHHGYFIRAYAVYAFYNLFDSVVNLFFLFSRESLLYMIAHKQSLRGRYHRKVKTAIVTPRLTV